MAGLREQWRREARRAIQEHALDLFDERGFDAVTIEQIAAAAQVSPSSVYRYFRTKEGLVVADDLDLATPEQLAELLDAEDPVDALVEAVRAYETTAVEGDQTSGPWRRVRYFFAEPAVRRALTVALDEAAQRVAPVLAQRHGLSTAQSRVAANALAFGYFAALETWSDDDGAHPISRYVEEGLSPLRGLWSRAAH